MEHSIYWERHAGFYELIPAQFVGNQFPNRNPVPAMARDERQRSLIYHVHISPKP
jgi:hypothetical protein